MGVILGEEEYRKNNGEIGTRLYVNQVRSIQAIQDGTFNVPELKKLAGQFASIDYSTHAGFPAGSKSSDFAKIDDSDYDLPF